jgi:hypothetical protein
LGTVKWEPSHLGNVVRSARAIDEHVRTLLDGTPGFVFQTLGEAELEGALGTGAWASAPRERRRW